MKAKIQKIEKEVVTITMSKKEATNLRILLRNIGSSGCDNGGSKVHVFANQFSDVLDELDLSYSWKQREDFLRFGELFAE